jgi:L-lactate dehydrogenase complex protein LldG
MATRPAQGAAIVTKARAAILGKVRGVVAARRSAGAVTARPDVYIRPQRAQGDRSELVSRFREMALFAGASVDVIASDEMAPAAAARYLSRHGLGDRLVLSPSERLRRMPWSDTPRLSVHRSRFGGDDRVAVTEAVAGVSETGTLLVRSGSDSPNALHLLPEAHVAILDSSAIVGSYEDALAVLGREQTWPRAATFITGPSRTADIEKTPQIGVHGPRQLHMILIHGETT